MKIRGQEFEDLAEKALKACLSRVPFLRIEEIRKDFDSGEVRPDFLIKLSLPDGDRYLVLELKSNGQPRLAREAVNQILRYRDLFPDAYGVFVAPYISPRAAEICAQEKIGYLDLAGNCRLCLGRVYIEKEGKPNVFARKRDLRSLYSPRAERVLRVLLNAPAKAWKIKELADEAQVSLGQVSNVKKLLMDREWIQVEPSGFILSEPDHLLQEWSENYSFRKHRIRNFYSLKNIAEIESDLAEIYNRTGLKYALTGFSGAARLSPAVRYHKATAYVEEMEEDFVAQLSIKEVTSGANLSLLCPYDEGVFYGGRYIDHVCIASPIQIYLDLRGLRGRGEEAAQVLFDQVVKRRW